jgi:hypothetical protein
VKSRGIPPFAKNPKDGAPDPSFQGKNDGFLLRHAAAFSPCQGTSHANASLQAILKTGRHEAGGQDEMFTYIGVDYCEYRRLVTLFP